MQVKAEFPEKLQCLFIPKRYKILYGGRGGAKSWGIARALLIKGAERPLRILCAREIQKSIQDSVHQLLKDQIEALGLSGFYEILNSEIRGKNGTLFVFAGLKHNVGNIKSKEGIDIVWVEEAQTVSKSSWETLIPTIRKENSEIWVSYNPELEEDETHQRFVIKPPSESFVVKLNWNDNPWFPDVLRMEKDELKVKDPDAYLNVWEGHCRVTLDGAIYAKELREAQEQGRICKVPYDQSKPVHTFWDFGWADKTSIWFAQSVGFEYRILDFYENRQQKLAHYLKVLQDKSYVYGIDYLPHDARSEQVHTKSIASLMKEAGRNIVVLNRDDRIENGINAARTIFSQCYFDQDKCADGLQALRRYRYDVDPDTGQFSKKPLHDESSHAADAFRYLAVSIKGNVNKPKDKPKHHVSTGPQGWMG